MTAAIPGFNPTEFRDAIEFAMTALSPADEDQKVTFYFKQSATYVDEHGAPVPVENGQPIRKAGQKIIKQTNAKPPVRIPVAVDYIDGDGAPLPFGGYAADARLLITVLDRHWSQVEDCTHVIVGGDIYQRRRTPPATGMGGTTVYTLIFVADKEA